MNDANAGTQLVTDAPTADPALAPVLEAIAAAREVLVIGPAPDALESALSAHSGELRRESDEAWMDSPDEPAAAERSADLVLAWDLVNRCVDPAGVLRRLAGRLRSGGVLAFSVANLAHGDVLLSLLNGRFLPTAAGVLDHDYVRHFTFSSLMALLAPAGLEPVSLQRIRRPLFETEQAVAADSISGLLAAQVGGRPEADTYRFVLVARAAPEGVDVLDELHRFAAAEREAAQQRAGELAEEAAAQLGRLHALTPDLAGDEAVLRGRITELSTEVTELRRQLLAACLAEAKVERISAELHHLHRYEQALCDRWSAQLGLARVDGLADLLDQAFTPLVQARALVSDQLTAAAARTAELEQRVAQQDAQIAELTGALAQKSGKLTAVLPHGSRRRNWAKKLLARG